MKSTFAGLQGEPVSGQPCHKEGINFTLACSASVTTAAAASQYASRVAGSNQPQPVYPQGDANVRAKRKPDALASRTAAREVEREALGPPVPHAPQNISNKFTDAPRNAVVPAGQGLSSAVTQPLLSSTQNSERVPGVAEACDDNTKASTQVHRWDRGDLCNMVVCRGVDKRTIPPPKSDCAAAAVQV